jgi:hypothetical protein
MKNNFFTVALILVVSISTSQNEKKDAKRLFNNSFPVGITAGYHFNDFKNTPTTGYTYTRDQNSSYAVGLDYNFIQTGRFNFSLGAFYKQLNSNGDFSVPAQDQGALDAESFSFERNLGFFSLRLKSEFVKQISGNHFASLSIGIQGDFMDDDDLAGTSLRYASSDTPEATLAALNFNETFGLEIDTPISLAYYYKSEKSGLFKFDITYSFRDIYNFGDEIRNVNLDEGAGTRSFHQWRGGYTAISLSWFPKWTSNIK